MRAYPELDELDREGRFDRDEMTVPDRSLAQRQEALNRANEIRSYRAQLKRDLKAGREDIIDLIAFPPPQIDTMKIFDLLLSVPKFGRVKTNKILVTCRISPSKTIGGMSSRQRDEVLRLLRRR